MEKLNLSDVDQVHRYLLSFDAFEGAPQEGINYVNDALRRFLITMDMVPSAREPEQKLLELGAGPYYLTVLLLNQTQYQMELANFFGEAFGAGGVQTVKHKDSGKHYEFQYRNFNVETDLFPYDDETFSMVLSCEIIEHLTMDPTHMLCEIHRVLEPGGYLLLTTPNVLTLRYVGELLRKRNIFHPYSGYGVYGRHQREYTLDELTNLIGGCGYEIVETRLEDLHPSPLWSRLLKRLRPLRREHLFVLACSTGSRRYYYPRWLYNSTHAIRRVVSSEVRMGWNDVGHLGLGWWELDPLDPPLRWTQQEAHIHLLLTAGATAVEAEVCPGPKGMLPVRFSLGVVGLEQEQCVTLETDAWQTITLTLPEMSEEQIDVVLRVDKTRNPAALEINLDARDLGVMVRRVAVLHGD